MKKTRQLNIRIPQTTWLRVHTELPNGNISQIITRILENYINNPNHTQTRAELEKKILKLRANIQIQQQKLIDLETLREKIIEEEEQTSEHRKKEQDKNMKIGIQIMKSMDAAGDKRELDF